MTLVHSYIENLFANLVEVNKHRLCRLLSDNLPKTTPFFRVFLAQSSDDISKYLVRIIGSLNYKPCDKKYRGSAFFILHAIVLASLRDIVAFVNVVLGKKLSSILSKPQYIYILGT